MHRALPSRRARLNEAFVAALATHKPLGPWPAGMVLGVEHEYFVGRGDDAVDFRFVVHGLDLGRRWLDPGDTDAYRLPTGVMVTADGPEAEIALPPLYCTPGFARRAAHLSSMARRELFDPMAPNMTFRGFSTHLSVSGEIGDAFALRWAGIFAPGLMLLMARPDSPGLLVRPRPGRLEIGGEYVVGKQLRIAALYMVGSVRACLASSNPTDLPESISMDLLPDPHRFGWMVPRAGFGLDLYEFGRDAELKLESGSMTTAQTQLAACWKVAGATLGDDAGGADLREVDDVVYGEDPLPLRQETGSSSEPANPGRPHLPDPYGQALEPFARRGFEAAVVMLTWRTIVFLVRSPDGRRQCFLALPGPALEAFLHRLKDGAFDRVIRGYLRARPGARQVAALADGQVVGLFDELGRRFDLLPTERAPMTEWTLV